MTVRRTVPAHRGRGYRGPVPADTVEGLLGLLRERGSRITPGRRAVVEALVHAPGHVTAEDVVISVQAKHPDVHVSTVYRTLESLEQAGIVAHVHMGHGAAVWHLAEDDRLHLVCDDCGDVVHIPPHLFDDVRDQLLADHGFEATLDHFAVPGRCRRCTNAAPA